jgi:tetratricopeptide (TPR) repeat protein
MPSHTYAQLGRYADATRVNQAAVAADAAMELELKRQNFTVTKDWRGHNLHFQWYAALMEGRGDLALSTARTLALRNTGDNTYAEYMRSLPMLTLLRLQRWEALRQEPLPSGDKGVATALGQMARGIALAHAGQQGAAQAAQARLDPAADKLVKEHPGTGKVDKLIRSLARSAQAQLRAEIAWSGQHADKALAQQQAAVAASQDADATEPPTLASGAGLRLGAMQLQARRYAAAEQSFRAHLAEHPGNGWALQGLRQALAAQGRQAEAQAADRELERTWRQADGGLRAAAR